MQLKPMELESNGI